MKSVGIDIGSYSIKVVEIQTTTKGFQVTQYYEHRLSNAANSDHELESIEFLRDLTSRFDHTQTRFIMCLPQERVAMRYKPFPFSDRTKIHKSLPFELEEDIPFSFENAIFDAKIVKTIGPTAEVLACAAPKTQIEKALQTAQDMGVELSILAIEGAAFANTVERWGETPASQVAPSLQIEEIERPIRYLQIVLNIGHKHTLICAFENHTLIGSRSIPWGGKNIVDAIAQKYEIPFIEATKELEAKGFILTNKQGATFDQVTFSETIAKSVREMVRDLQMSILEFKSEFNASIVNIGLTGGASQIQNLSPFLTQMLELPVNKTSSLHHFPNTLFERTASVEAKIGLALGLAVEGLKKPRNPPINFLRGEFAKQNHRLQAFWGKWRPALQVALGAVLALYIYSNLRESFSASLAERAQEVLKTQAKSVAKLSSKNSNEKGIKNYIRENKKRAADLKTLSSVAGMNSALDILKKVSEATPAKNSLTVDVRKLLVEQNQVMLEGYLGSAREVTLLQQSLVNITVDGHVDAKTSSLPHQLNRTAFAFSFQVDRGIQKVTK